MESVQNTPRYQILRLKEIYYPRGIVSRVGMGDGIVALGWDKGRQQAAAAGLSFSFFSQEWLFKKKKEESMLG